MTLLINYDRFDFANTLHIHFKVRNKIKIKNSYRNYVGRPQTSQAWKTKRLLIYIYIFFFAYLLLDLMILIQCIMFNKINKCDLSKGAKTFTYNYTL